MINWVVTPFQVALGGVGVLGLINAQCPSYLAPCSIQRLKEQPLWALAFFGFGRRHELIGIGGGDACPEFTISQLAGHNDVCFGFRFHIQTQFAFATFFVRPMAGETFVGRMGRISRLNCTVSGSFSSLNSGNWAVRIPANSMKRQVIIRTKTIANLLYSSKSGVIRNLRFPPWPNPQGLAQ